MTTTYTIQSVKPTKSEIMSWYNKAKVAGAKGILDVNRINRALGWLQSNEPHTYNTTIENCDCKDHQARPSIACKHMIGTMILARIVKARPAKVAEQPAVTKLQTKYSTLHLANDISFAQQINAKTWEEHIFSSNEDLQNWRNANHVMLITTNGARGRKVAIHDHRDEIIA